MNRRIRYMHWLWHISKFSSVEEEDVDREGGKLYGFPKCCIDNYVAISKQGIRSIGSYMDEHFGKDDLHEIAGNPHVRCEKCRRKP